MRDFELLKDFGIYLEPEKLGNDSIKAERFYIGGRRGVYQVLAGETGGWEHMSVATIVEKDEKQTLKTATYEELSDVADIFFGDSAEDISLEYFFSSEDEKSPIPEVSHLWSPTEAMIPLPPSNARVVANNVIKLPKKHTSLLVKWLEKNGWTGYELTVLRNGKVLKRVPNRQEIDIALARVCGNRTAVRYYGLNEDKSHFSTRLWVIPRGIEFPVPSQDIREIVNSFDIMGYGDDSSIKEDRGKAFVMQKKDN